MEQETPESSEPEVAPEPDPSAALATVGQVEAVRAELERVKVILRNYGHSGI